MSTMRLYQLELCQPSDCINFSYVNYAIVSTLVKNMTIRKCQMSRDIFDLDLCGETLNLCY